MNIKEEEEEEKGKIGWGKRSKEEVEEKEEK